MPEAPSSIFNQKATDKLRSPDDLDRFIRVTNPSVWVMLAACVALLAGLLAWGIFGAVSTSVTSTGVSIKGKTMCFLDAENAAKVHEGDTAYVGGERMEVKTVSSVPYSRDEARGILGNDYLVSTLVNGDWAYVVGFSGRSGLTDGVPLTVTITVERVAPISLILKNWG